MNQAELVAWAVERLGATPDPPPNSKEAKLRRRITIIDKAGNDLSKHGPHLPLPPHVEREIQRILDGAARRLRDELASKRPLRGTRL